MATYDRRKSTSIREGLTNTPAQFNFYQAVHLLAATNDENLSLLENIDHSLDFTCDAGNQFHANDLSNVTFKDTDKIEVSVATFGLSGPLGPLPQQHSEWVASDARAGNSELKDFLSIFEHRFISLLYLIKQRFQTGLHRGPRSSSDIYRYLETLSGLPLTSKASQHSERYIPLLPFAGLLAGGRASAASVSNILTILLNAPIKISSMRGAFIKLDSAYQAKLTAKPNGTDVVQRLGDNVALGKRVWDQQNAIEIDIGPVDYQVAQTWIPGATDYSRLVDLLRYTTNGQWVLHAVINVRESTIPASQFSNGMRLGFNSWLKTSDQQGELGGDGTNLKQTRRTINPIHIH